MKTKNCLLFFIVIISLACSGLKKSVNILQVPGRDQFCKIDENGISILPSGRYATPVGELLRITEDPFGMDISPDRPSRRIWSKRERLTR